MRGHPRSWSEPPGGALPWLIVGLELATFTIVFGVLARLRATEPALFRAGQAALSQTAGLSMTLLLVTSGAIAAHGIVAFRAGNRPAATRRITTAAAVGTAFVVTKLWDYSHLAAQDLWLGRNLFWDAFVLATGFHLLHVLVGILALLGAARALGRSTTPDPETSIVGPILFWHMCDVVWFFLWPLFYARCDP